MKKLTRRNMLAAAAALPAVAQTPAGTSAQDWAKAAREANQRNGDILAKIKIPMAVEPAAQFKA